MRYGQIRERTEKSTYMLYCSVELIVESNESEKANFSIVATKYSV